MTAAPLIHYFFTGARSETTTTTNDDDNELGISPSDAARRPTDRPLRTFAAGEAICSSLTPSAVLVSTKYEFNSDVGGPTL